jgi:hypothetical protein
MRRRRAPLTAAGHRESGFGLLQRFVASDDSFTRSGSVARRHRYQRCMVHFYRNVFSHVPSTRVREVSHMLKAIHAQESREVERNSGQSFRGGVPEPFGAQSAAFSKLKPDAGIVEIETKPCDSNLPLMDDQLNFALDGSLTQCRKVLQMSQRHRFARIGLRSLHGCASDPIPKRLVTHQ